LAGDREEASPKNGGEGLDLDISSQLPLIEVKSALACLED
jgi:hypothetical protein